MSDRPERPVARAQPQSRFLLIDPSLRDDKGHNLVLARAFAAWLGLDRVDHAVNREAPANLALAGHSIMRSFRLTMTQAARIRRYGRIGLGLLDLAERISPLLPALRSRLHPVDNQGGISHAQADAAGAQSLHTRDLLAACAVFAPRPHDGLVFGSADSEQALAAAELLETRSAAGGALIHLRLMYDDVARHSTDFAWSSVLARVAAAPQAESRVRFSAETAAFAAFIESRTGRPAAVIPHPSRLAPTPMPPRRDPFVLLLPGEARGDKGLAFLRAVVAALDASVRGRLLIRVQAPVAESGIEPLPAHLDAEAYANAWATCHAALLLHDPVVYRLRGSGVVCDAVRVGRPFLCLAGSSLAEWARDGNGLIVAPEPALVARAIGRLVETYDSYAVNIGKAQARLDAMLALAPSRI